ncbi:hypothetical protein OG905_19785 [Streptomyces sp. NBC_00322]|uniref:hypothetical protein n=1 Tax=Streptomyces sp. NBC_00322 TaxID=2975712 RepID=UPI002E28C876|nr:hypothetical protein [Streptomyces sp. NBC_00322]
MRYNYGKLRSGGALLTLGRETDGSRGFEEYTAPIGGDAAPNIVILVRFLCLRFCASGDAPRILLPKCDE